MKKLILALALTVTLAACATPAAKPAPMKLDYSSLGALTLNVQNFSVINRTLSLPSRAPYVTSQFHPSVTEAIYRWANDRIRTNGRVGNATLIIKEASVTEQAMQMDTGIESWFTRQQSHKYLAKVEIDVEARTPDGMNNAFATAHASRYTTLPEDPTEAEKAKAYEDMLTQLMSDLNLSLENAMRAHMGAFIAQ